MSLGRLLKGHRSGELVGGPDHISVPERWARWLCESQLRKGRLETGETGECLGFSVSTLTVLLLFFFFFVPASAFLHTSLGGFRSASLE